MFQTPRGSKKEISGMGSSDSGDVFLVNEEYTQIVIPLLEKAKCYIRILMFDWRMYEKDAGANISLLNSAIARAVLRGCRVRAVVNFPGAVAPLKALKIDVRTIKTKRTMHCKILLIDSAVLVVGSHNFSIRAHSANFESSIVTSSARLYAGASDLFEKIWSS